MLSDTKIVAPSEFSDGVLFFAVIFIREAGTELKRSRHEIEAEQARNCRLKASGTVPGKRCKTSRIKRKIGRKQGVFRRV